MHLGAHNCTDATVKTVIETAIHPGCVVLTIIWQGSRRFLFVLVACYCTFVFIASWTVMAGVLWAVMVFGLVLSDNKVGVFFLLLWPVHVRFHCLLDSHGWRFVSCAAFWVGDVVLSFNRASLCFVLLACYSTFDFITFWTVMAFCSCGVLLRVRFHPLLDSHGFLFLWPAIAHLFLSPFGQSWLAFCELRCFLGWWRNTLSGS